MKKLLLSALISEPAVMIENQLKLHFFAAFRSVSLEVAQWITTQMSTKPSANRNLKPQGPCILWRLS